jgi:hypothetical protein
VGSEVPDDAELSELALAAADPNLPIADDARPVAEVLGWPTGALPAWYASAPVPGARQRRRWQRAVVVGLVGTFVVLEALGLCTVFGHLVVG